MILLYHYIRFMSILNRIHFDSNTKIKAPASPAKGRRSSERPRQIVTPVSCPAGHTSDAIPTGPAPRACRPSAGDCMERNQPLAPPYASAPITTQAPPVAGHPVPASATPLYCKNTLRLTLKWCRIVAPRQIKGRAWRVRSSPRPYAGDAPLPHNSIILRQPPL